MILVLLIIGLSIVTLLLIYDYLHAKIQARKSSAITAVTHSELEKLRINEADLKQEITALQDKLHLSLEDPITHLPIRDLFEDRLKVAVKESARYQLTMGVLQIELNNFNIISEALNYDISNQIILQAGERLQTCIRQIDTVSRFNGNSFGILLEKLNKPETAVIIAQRILQAFAEPFCVNKNELYLTVSIGIAIYPADASDPGSLLKDAETALILAKEKGNNTYQFYQKDVQVAVQRKLSLYSSVSRESIFQECILYYQPIVNIQNKKIECVDVLLSYQHQTLGIISSNELFEAAEKQGKLNNISVWLIEKACQEFLHWNAQGFNPELIAITLPSKQLEAHHFVYNLSQILQKIGFDPKHLLLQIKGSFNLSLEFLERIFNQLNYLGVKIAIDDFSSVNLPLHYLTLGIHYLKLDPALIAKLNENSQAQTLLKSIVFLAQNLSMQVIAKGVDTERQMSECKKTSCKLMQGQFFYPPLQGSEIVEKVSGATLEI